MEGEPSRGGPLKDTDRCWHGGRAPSSTPSFSLPIVEHIGRLTAPVCFKDATATITITSHSLLATPTLAPHTHNRTASTRRIASSPMSSSLTTLLPALLTLPVSSFGAASHALAITRSPYSRRNSPRPVPLPLLAFTRICAIIARTHPQLH
jgi:hypothetical protein